MHDIQAGFLTLGSTYSLRLPTLMHQSSGTWQISSPITAAGPLPISTGFPIKPQWHLIFYYINPAQVVKPLFAHGSPFARLADMAYYKGGFIP